MQRAASGIASLALRRLLPAAAAPRSAPVIGAAGLPPAAAGVVRLLHLSLQPAAAPAAAALCARRGYARKAKAVSEDEEDEDDEFEAMGSDGEFDGDFDDEDLEDFDDDDGEVSGSGSDDEDRKPVQKRRMR